MDNLDILSFEKHGELKVDARPAEAYGDHVNRALAFATEFDELHKEFPIVFHKDPATGEFQAHVILGFDKNENLFLGDGVWLSDYVPAALARGPFIIGVHNQDGDDDEHKESLILVDTDNPRVGVEGGEPVFLPDGGNTAYLESVIRALQVIDRGADFEKTLSSSLESMNLLEPVSIDLTLSNIEQVNLRGYYTINTATLAELDGTSLERLHKSGVLRLVYFALSSLDNLHKMIEMKAGRAALA